MSDHPQQIFREAQHKIEQYEREVRLARQKPKREVRRRIAHFMVAVARRLEPDLNLTLPTRERTLS